MADTELYNSSHTGAEIDSAVTRALPGGAIDQDIAGKMPALESADYPGCYYHTQDGVQEWINPPLVDGVEYRTAERFCGLPVYQIAINTGLLSEAGVTATITYAETGIVKHVVSFGGWDTYHSQVMPNPELFSVGVNKTRVSITGVIDMSEASCLVWIRYTKTADAQ